MWCFTLHKDRTDFQWEEISLAFQASCSLNVAWIKNSINWGKKTDHDWSNGEIANPFELGPRNTGTNGESLNNT